MVETLSYTRENISNRSYTVSNIEDVPANHQNTAKLYVCSAIASMNTKNNIKQAKIQLKARRRRKNFRVFLTKGLSHTPPGEGGVSKLFYFKALIRVLFLFKVLCCEWKEWL